MNDGFFSVAVPAWRVALVLLLLNGCASGPPRDGPWSAPVEEAGARGQPHRGGNDAASAQVAARAAEVAEALVGTPYRYGGAQPDTGFDCSGLIQYSYRRAGVRLPRTTDDQREVSQLIPRSALRRGDLLFFDQEGQKNSHAGIYLGRGFFVHAPSSGKRVRRDRIESPYWRRYLSEARRLELSQ